MEREEAIKYLISPVATTTAIGEEKLKEFEAYNMAIEALSAEPTVIRSKTLMPTKDFKEWAKRVRENNPSVIVIPCDAEVVPVELTATNTKKSSNCGDLISREDAIDTVNRSSIYAWSTEEALAAHNWAIRILQALPSADRPHGEWKDIDSYYRMATCSHCHKVTMFEKWGEYIKPYNYCPNCGADMRNQNNEQC